jgi:hypothetical protein
MEYDDSVRSKGIAYAIAAYFLDNSKTMGSASANTNTIYAYLFDRAGKSTAVFWSKDKALHFIKPAAGVWQAFNIMGNSLSVPAGGIPVGRTPVYLQTTLAPVDALPALRNATITDAPDTTAPNVSIDEFPVGTTTQRPITFRWTGVDETSIPSAAEPNAVLYSYRLLGLTDQWSPWSAGTHVTFNSLPAGQYTLAVRSKDKAGNISNDVTRTVVVAVAPAGIVRPL